MALASSGDFELEGRRFPLIDRSRGTWNPRELDATLSIVSVADGPYGDHRGADGRVHIDSDLLDEVDGPMLRHGLQDMHGVEIAVPRRAALRPSRDAFEERFTTFGR